MSFWNFLGEFALFNMICNLFSGKPKSQHQSYPLLYDQIHDTEYETRIEELQRIIDSERAYVNDDADADADALQDRIDKLEDQLDDIEDRQDIYEELQDELHDLQDEMDVIKIDRDDDL